ncbi:MAG: site-2 protease family protein [Fimbriiglobus sp.]|nr:site-2 protease family protein [Fimbriiglobus sp.]
MDPTPNPVNHAHDGKPATDPGHLPPEPLVPVPVPKNDVNAWVKVNGWKLLVMVAIVAFVCWKYYWLDVLLAGLGLSGIIFLHELGHFLAAKACNVYVRTFSIGFGPAWPFCQFKYGETNYKLGMIPLGGFVAMAGENTGETDPDAEKDDVDDDTDPRSFKNRPVWQRMIIISAGVIMNVILAAVCFVVAYSFGVKEMPPVVQAVEPGSAAWQAGLRPGSEIARINGIHGPWFADIPPEVASTNRGSTVHLETTYRGTPTAFDIEPQVAEGAYNPTLGLTFPTGVQLDTAKRDPLPPFAPGSPADKATPAGEDGIKPGDTIIGMTDPADPTKVTPLEDNWNGLPGKTFDYRRRLSALAGKEITLDLQRQDSAERVKVTLPAAFRHDSGIRFKMGQIAAVRAGSSAAAANFNLQKMDSEKVLSDGDVIARVTVNDGGGTRVVFDPTDKAANNPLRLPFELNKWATNTPGDKMVSVTVQPAGGGDPRTVELAWDDAAREDGFQLGSPNAPLPLGGLGLAYRVSNEIADVAAGSPAATAGLKAGDTLTDVRFNLTEFKRDGGAVSPKPKAGSWDRVKSHHGAFLDYKLQVQPPHSFDFKADRGGVLVEGTVSATTDVSWGVPYTGLNFLRELKVQKADGFADALRLGTRRTVRGLQTNYQGLYGMAVGRISPLTMSGPITLASMSYKLAGEDLTTLVLFLGLISVSLAVVNFLPIPVLDGGHMMFLLYEAIFRKPPPTFIHFWLTILGLVAVLCLMTFTIGLDIWRHFIAG